VEAIVQETVRRGLLIAFVAVVLAAGSGPDDERSTASTTSVPEEPADLYEASATVLESPEHGPELCLGGMEESLPPQCGGPAVLGWDWAAVDGEDSASGTTWGDYHVVGTWDGEALTVTEAPGPPRYDDAPDPGFTPVCDEPTGDPEMPPIETWSTDGIADLVRVFVSQDPWVLNVVVRPGGAEAAEAEVRRSWPGLLCVAERAEPTAAELDAVQSEVDALFDEESPLGQPLSSGTFGTQPFVSVSVVVLTDEGRAYAEERWGDLVQVTGRLQPVTQG
jgi:hypothetical protein